MNVIHEQVQHQQFGYGNVTEQAETIITVQFCEEYGTKKFLYPSAFEKFLVLCNPASQEQIDEELLKIREQTEAERKQQEDKAERRLEEERLKQLELKKSAAKKRPSTKSGAKKTTAKSQKQSQPAEDLEDGEDA